MADAMDQPAAQTPATQVPAAQVPAPQASADVQAGVIAPSAPSGGVSASTSTGSGGDAGQRESFNKLELAIVMSHFDIGIIEEIKEFPRGSRKAPKLYIVTDEGKFLLKRRAAGRADPYKVAFTHAIQLELAAKQFPLPHLIGTKKTNNSMLQWGGGVYELFEFIPGSGYSHSLEATYDGGRVLGLFHKLLADFATEHEPTAGSYHKAPAVERGLVGIPNNLSRLPGVDAANIEQTCQFLLKAYRNAAQGCEAQGLSTWPSQIAHADWHPGNMLFREDRVVAVIDYDSARLLPRIVDMANGALQFSIIGGDENVAKWPDYVDESRFKRFCRAYDGTLQLSQAEIAIIPHLMAEALIAEAVFPIAATGNFGRMDGAAFLDMVRRKVTWLQANHDRLVEMVEA
ncbi:MAG: phosphotransferase enzyme family protein [Phycisphaerae bacterium]